MTSAPKLQAFDLGALVVTGQVAELLQYQPADSVELLVAQVDVEGLVEFLDGGERADDVIAVAELADEAVGLEIGLVLDLADDLLQHILDGDQPRHAAVLVDDDGHVVAVLAEFSQQHVQTLAFGHHVAGAEQPHEVEILVLGLQQLGQQVFYQQDAQHVVRALADHRVAGMGGLDDMRQHFLEGQLRLDHLHL